MDLVSSSAALILQYPKSFAALFLVASIAAYSYYRMHSRDTYACAQIKGQTVVITGANSGIGFECAATLGGRGAHVILACRNLERGTKALNDLRKRNGGSYELLTLDTSSLTSVRAFARTLIERGTSIDVLINNAGIMMNPTRELSDDGFELQLATNHLGHFALVGQLMPLFNCKTGKARIVNVSSSMSLIGSWKRFGPGKFDFRRDPPNYHPGNVYGDSKLANLMFTSGLNKRYGDKIVAVSAHPGGTSTNLQKHAFNDRLTQMFLMRPANGARPLERAASETSAKPGDYFGPFYLGVGWPVGGCYIPSQARDDRLVDAFWAASVVATTIKY